MRNQIHAFFHIVQPQPHLCRETYLIHQPYIQPNTDPKYEILKPSRSKEEKGLKMVERRNNLYTMFFMYVSNKCIELPLNFH